MKTILLIGTLDTKGQEYAFVYNLIRERGHQPLLMNAGTFPSEIKAELTVDISAQQVAEAGGTTLAALQAANDRGEAMSAMQKGVEVLIQQLFSAGKIDAVLGLGGSGGTALATAGMRTLPVGVPKLMVSTLASGDVAAYTDIKDITMMYSVVDIAGLNRLSKQILSNAAGMICGAAEQAISVSEDKPLIAATMFGVTTPCMTKLQAKLEQAGYEVLIFHATGSGGRAMEGLITDGFIAGVADVTTTEWCDEFVGGVLAAGPDRLDAAGQIGCPQVVSVGALDMVNFWAMDTVPEKFQDRNLYKHNENITLMRTTPEENRSLGQIIAAKLNAANGPTTLVLPLKGVSMIDVEGQPFHDPAADQALFDTLRTEINDHVKLVEVDAHINDDAFVDALASELLAAMN